MTEEKKITYIIMRSDLSGYLMVGKKTPRFTDFEKAQTSAKNMGGVVVPDFECCKIMEHNIIKVVTKNLMTSLLNDISSIDISEGRKDCMENSITLAMHDLIRRMRLKGKSHSVTP